jgi:hypothetical protein
VPGSTGSGSVSLCYAGTHDSEVVELRQCTLHPGRREELIALFDGSLVEPQEELGIRVWASSATWTIQTGSSGYAASTT